MQYIYLLGKDLPLGTLTNIIMVVGSAWLQDPCDPQC